MAPIRYVIVGGSAAGMAAAQAIRQTDAHGHITVLSEEVDRPYFRPLIPFLVSGQKTEAQMALEGCGPYTGGQIKVLTDSRAENLDIETHCIALADGRQIPYDRLLLATGSQPFLPPDIQGLQTSGVFALRTLGQARDMAERAAKSRHAVMLGGGLLNLKAAFALLARGLKVTLVVYSPEVLSQLMEPRDAGLIRQALDTAGLEILTDRSAVEILSDAQGVCGVTLDDGSRLDCQMVCIGKGVAPNVEFLEGSGVHIDGGIVADRYTACNVPGIHAAGDVAVTFDPITGQRMVTGLWTNAVEMGRCAGFNMAGIQTAYGGTFGILNATQIAGLPFVSMGIVHTGGTDYQVHTRATPTTLRKIVFSKDGDQLVGALFIGDITNAGMYRYVIREQLPINGLKPHLVDQTLHYGHFLNRRSYTD